MVVKDMCGVARQARGLIIFSLVLCRGLINLCALISRCSDPCPLVVMVGGSMEGRDCVNGRRAGVSRTFPLP